MPPGENEQPPTPRIRASDKDRDAVLAVITEAVTNGRLDPEETGERQDGAIAAKFLDELLPLIHDLPEGRDLYFSLQRQTGTAPGQEIGIYEHSSTVLSPRAEPGSASPVNSVAIMSGKDIDVAPGTDMVTNYVLMGGDEIDVCEVMGPGVTVTLTSYSLMGGNNVYVPPGVRIKDETINIMAGNDTHRGARGDGSNGTLILKGVSMMAGHDIHLAKGYRGKDQRSLN